MSGVKKKIFETIGILPEDILWNDAMYALYLESKLKKSKEDIKNGRVMTIEESKERMKRQYEGFDVK